MSAGKTFLGTSSPVSPFTTAYKVESKAPLSGSGSDFNLVTSLRLPAGQMFGNGNSSEIENIIQRTGPSLAPRLFPPRIHREFHEITISENGVVMRKPSPNLCQRGIGNRRQKIC